MTSSTKLDVHNIVAGDVPSRTVPAHLLFFLRRVEIFLFIYLVTATAPKAPLVLAHAVMSKPPVDGCVQRL